MKENNQKRIILSIMAIAVLIAVLAAGTYAFFAATISGDDTATSIQITASSDGTVIEFTGGEEVNLEGIYPRTASWLTKDITIHTTGSSGAVSKPMYTFNIVVTDNDFDLDDIQYTFTNKVHTGVDAGYTETSTKTNMATRYDIAHGTVDVSGEVTVTYTLNVYFVNAEDRNQNIGSERNVRFYITYGWGAPVELTRVVDGVTTKTYVPENTEITLDSPTKEGYIFTGWTAEGATVVGDKLAVGNTAVKITANFSGSAPDPVNFTTDSWATIAAYVKANKEATASVYSVGSEKKVEIDVDGDGTAESYTVRIANNSHYGDDCMDDQGKTLDSKTACGFVVEFVDIVEQRAMNDTPTNKNGWPATEMRTYLNGEFLAKLSSDLQSVIADTTVVSGHGSNDSSNFTSTDKLYLLSTKEVWEDETSNPVSSFDTAYNSTRQLDYYANNNVTTSNYRGAIKNYAGSDAWWWLRAANSNRNNNFLRVNSSGDWNNGYAISSYGVAPAFRIE